MSKNIIPLTAERLRELLHYDPETGVFVWRVRCGHALPGAVAGGVDYTGYHYIKLDTRRYGSHRLAWLHTYGAWPSDSVDHVNGAKADNRIQNLRDVPRRVNMQNQKKPHTNNVAGFLGVYKAGRRWRAQIRHEGTARNLGRHDTPEQAHAAYLCAKRKLHAGCTL
jgi:hypothetical protein